MKSFVVALMMDDVSVWTFYFLAWGGENDGRRKGGGKWGGVKLGGGSVHVLLRLVGSGVKEMDTGLL